MKPVSIDAICSLQYLSGLTFSPKGTHLVFAVSRADREKNTYTSCLYELRGRKTVQLTSGGRERAFQFLDEDTILFPGDRDGKDSPGLGSKFYRLNLNGGEAVKALEFPIPVEKLLALPDGDFLVVGQTVPGFEELYRGDPKEAARYQAWQKENADYEVVDQVPWWWNGAGNTRSTYSSLFRYDSKKRTLRRLTDLNVSVSDVQLTPDKKAVWFQIAPVQPLLPMEEGITLCRMDLQEEKPETVVESVPGQILQGYALGEHFAIVLISDQKYGSNTDGDFYKLSYTDHSLTLYKEYGEAIGTSVGSDVRYGGGRAMKMVGDTLYFTTTLYDCAHLCKLENGEISFVTRLDGSVDAFDVCGDQIRVIALWDMRPQEIYDEKGTRLTSFNRKALSGTYIAQPLPCNVTVSGHEVHGFVLPPKDYVPGQKYPVIFDIHGGPKTVYGPVYYHEMQYWAGLGYFVIFCNPTGSDGRGAFADIRGKYGTQDFEDLIAFCDHALETWPDMDPRNVFETGGSYGGFMTNWIIGHTDRFAACASQRSISNWFSFFGVSDIGVMFTRDQCQADPWQDPEKLWYHSPLRYADKVKTPTLFIHAFEDYRCPIDQGYQMYTALIAHGVESKMVLFKGENHDLSRSGKPLHRLRRLTEITNWFGSHRR